MRVILICAVFVMSCLSVAAQETGGGSPERRVALNEKAVAVDSAGAAILEATLKTTAVNGTEDSPVTNINLVVRNSSNIPYVFVSGLVTFYDGSGVRCGEGMFKAESLSADEAFEADTPGIRIRCAPSTWRIVANNWIPKVAAFTPGSPVAEAVRPNMNLIISIDGEEHPIQLHKPMTVKFGDAQRTIVLREAP